MKVEDSIGKFLPIMTANGKGRITISQCLSHLTGIKSGGLKESREIAGGKNSMNESMEAIAKLPMESEPGSAFHYSSIGLQIAAAIVEKLGNKPFEALFKERIAQPCEMLNTDFGNQKVPLAAGGAFSTPTEYLQFLEMILNNGSYKGKRILSPSSVELMQRNHTNGKKVVYSPAQAGNWGYGFGQWVMEETGPGKRSAGVTSPGLFGSFPWVDNKNNYAAVLFTFNLKSNGRGELYHSLKKLVDNAINHN